jgi:hypothetical protein
MLMNPLMWVLNTLMSLVVMLKLFGNDIDDGIAAVAAIVGVVGLFASLALMVNAMEISVRAMGRKRAQAQRENREREELRRMLEDTDYVLELGDAVGGGGATAVPVVSPSNPLVDMAPSLTTATATAGDKDELEMQMMKDIFGDSSGAHHSPRDAGRTMPAAAAPHNNTSGGSNSSGDQQQHQLPMQAAAAAAAASGEADADIDIELAMLMTGSKNDKRAEI